MDIQPKPSEANPVQPPQEQTKPVKEKKPRTEAQQAATAKALAAMTAARKERAKKQIETKEKVKEAVKVVKEKIIKEDIGFVMKNDFESRFGALQKELAEVRAMYAQSSSKPEKVASAPTPKERIVERIVERTPTPSAQPSRLTGHALLDKVFGFEK